MIKLSLKGRAWLKGLHIFLVCAWIGAGISMLLLGFAKQQITNGDELYAVNAAIKLIDDYIVIPAAMGTLLTGLMFSLFTNWGFIKFNWLIFKWFMTIAQILFGTFFLGPWVNGATNIADVQRIEALKDVTYLHFSQMNQYFGLLQVALLVVVVFVSVLKPWGKRNKVKAAK
jgi:uncharacterized membrane protein